MLQFIIAILAIITVKLVYDIIKEKSFMKPKMKSSRGEVININNAWVDLSQLPYKKRDRLLTVRELLLFEKINRILENSAYIAFPKVRLVDVLQLAVNAPNRPEYSQRVRERNVDLLICKKPDLTPLVVIMSDNNINENKKRSSADRFTRRVAEVTGLGYLMLNITESSDDHKILTALKNLGLEL